MISSEPLYTQTPKSRSYWERGYVMLYELQFRSPLDLTDKKRTLETRKQHMETDLPASIQSLSYNTLVPSTEQNTRCMSPVLKYLHDASNSLPSLSSTLFHEAYIANRYHNEYAVKETSKPGRKTKRLNEQPGPSPCSVMARHGKCGWVGRRYGILQAG